MTKGAVERPRCRSYRRWDSQILLALTGQSLVGSGPAGGLVAASRRNSSRSLARFSVFEACYPLRCNRPGPSSWIRQVCRGLPMKKKLREVVPKERRDTFCSASR